MPLALRVLIEKLPLLLLLTIFCGVTLWAQAGARVGFDSLPLERRIATALVSYTTYLKQFICPLGLAAFYSNPGSRLPIRTIFVALVILAMISAAAVAQWRRRPYLLMGWLWYLGTLVPVSGLAAGPACNQRADHFTYLPHIGLCIALAWGVADLSREVVVSSLGQVVLR